MESYQPLFSVSVTHLYFSDEMWKGLDFVPGPQLLKVMSAANILVLPTQNGIAVFYDDAKSDVLRLYADDTNGTLRFSFKVYANERTFENYTVPPVRGGNAVLCFDNGAMSADTQAGKIRLSRDDLVSGGDFKEIDALIVEGMLDESDRRMPPDFLVDIFIEPGKNGGLSAQDYVLKFNTRQSFWKYHLLGNMNRSNPFIVDLDSKVEFEFCGEVMLPGNKPSKVFRSKELIPVLENSDFRFQLREQGQGQGAGTGTVLIKRLPVASDSGMGFDVVNGKKEIVSESYINY